MMYNTGSSSGRPRGPRVCSLLVLVVVVGGSVAGWMWM